jgi:hypothetical protein
MTKTGRPSRLIAACGASLALAIPAAAAAEEPAPGVAFSGFVDGAALIPTSGYEPGARGVTFGVDQVELDLRAAPSPDLAVAADLNVFPSTAAPLTGDSLFEQAFVTWSPAPIEGLSLTLGKRNAPIGIESIDPVDMYQYSSGLLFRYATPSNLTGLFAGYEAGNTSALLMATAPWDTPAGSAGVLVGGRAQQIAGPATLGLSATHGPLPTPDEADPQLMVDVDAKVELDGLTLFGEFNYGSLGDDTSIGYLVAANYAVTSSTSVTLRGDSLDREFGTIIKQTDLTVALLHSLSGNLAATLEYKYQMPDQGDDQSLAALEFTAKF